MSSHTNLLLSGEYSHCPLMIHTALRLFTLYGAIHSGLRTVPVLTDLTMMSHLEYLVS